MGVVVLVVVMNEMLTLEVDEAPDAWLETVEVDFCGVRGGYSNAKATIATTATIAVARSASVLELSPADIVRIAYD